MAEWEAVCNLSGNICEDVRTTKTHLIFFFFFLEFFGREHQNLMDWLHHLENTIGYSRISTGYRRDII